MATLDGFGFKFLHGSCSKSHHGPLELGDNWLYHSPRLLSLDKALTSILGYHPFPVNIHENSFSNSYSRNLLVLHIMTDANALKGGWSHTALQGIVKYQHYTKSLGNQGWLRTTFRYVGGNHKTCSFFNITILRCLLPSPPPRLSRCWEFNLGLVIA